MHIDWSFPVGTILLLAVQFIGCVVAVMRLVAAMERAIESRFSALERTIDSRFGEIALMLNTFKEGDIRELRGRIDTIESGQDEWTKALRARTHSLGDNIQTMILQIDRLERSSVHIRATDAPDTR